MIFEHQHGPMPADSAARATWGIQKGARYQGQAAIRR